MLTQSLVLPDITPGYDHTTLNTINAITNRTSPGGSSRFTITSSSGREIECLGTDIAFIDARPQSYWVVAIHPTSCPASPGCNDTHDLLLVATYGDDYTWRMYDLSLFVLNGGQFTNLPVLNEASRNTDFQPSLRSAAQRVLGSMQFNGESNGFGYVAATYDRPISRLLSMEADATTSTDMVIGVYLPTARRLITTGESQSIVAPNSVNVWFDPPPITSTVRTGDMFEPLGNDVQVQRSDISPPTESIPDMSVTDGTDDALRRERLRVQELEDMLDKAARVALAYTRDNAGCDEGKTQFLTDLGLHGDPDEVREALGHHARRTYRFYIDVNMRVSIERELTSDEYEDFDESDIDQSDIDDAIRRFVNNDDADWTIVDSDVA